MTTGRWLAVALAAVGAFLLSVAAGGLIGRQLHVPAPTLVAVVSPAPSQAAAAGTAPAPTPTPTASSAPVATASVPPTLGAPAATPTTPVATATPSATGTPVPTASIVLDPATAELFAADLLAAIQTGDTTYLNDRLHPAVIDRYGVAQCHKHVVAFQPQPSATWTVVSSSGPAPWTWTTDNLETVIPDTWTVTITEPGTGQRDLHFAPADGTWRWFDDCGTPL